MKKEDIWVLNQQQRIKELLKKEEVDRLKEFFASFGIIPL
jgi:hypothetical protein